MSDRFYTMSAHPSPCPGPGLGTEFTRNRGRSILGLVMGLFLVLSWARAEIVLSLKNPGTAEEGGGASVVPDPESEAPEVRYDQVKLLNGDTFRGTFFSVDEKRGIRWRHPAIKQVLEIDPAGVSLIQLNRPQPTNMVSGQHCLLELTNDDELTGELVGVDTNEVTLKTWYAGTLKVPLPMARTIYPGQAPVTSLYEGPDELDKWQIRGSTSNRNRGGAMRGWEFKQGAFYCGANSSIGRELKLPDKTRLEFELSWSGYLNFGFSLYTEKLENYGGDCYMMQFNSGSVYLQRMNKQGNSSNLGHAQAEGLARQSKVRVTVLADKDKKTISLLLDGALAKQWTDRGEFSSGTGIGFFQQGQGLVRLRAIRISEWDGKLDMSESTGKEALKEDMVKLGNNDKISGRLQQIQEGIMKFGTEFATLDVPLDRIASINLAQEPSKELKPAPGEIRAYFVNRGSVTFRVKQWDDHQITGTSAQLGEVKFFPAAFSRIEFNLGKPKQGDGLADFEQPGPGISDVFFE